MVYIYVYAILKSNSLHFFYTDFKFPLRFLAPLIVMVSLNFKV